jgi:hypothetical protein
MDYPAILVTPNPESTLRLCVNSSIMFDFIPGLIAEAPPPAKVDYRPREL